MNRGLPADADYKLRILKSAPLFEAAAEDDLAELARLGRPIAVQRGVVFGRDQIAQVYLLQSGVCAERMVTPNGGRGLLTNLYGAGQIAGVANALTADEKLHRPLEALSNLSIVALPAADFLRVCRRSPELSEALGASLAAGNERLARVYANSLSHSLEKRLAEFFSEIVSLTSGAESHPEINLGKLSQSSVAEMLGVSREHVNKTISIWERSGLIFQNKRGDIFVQNAKRLASFSATQPTQSDHEDEFLWEIDAHLDRGLNQTAMLLSLEALRRSPKNRHYGHRAVLATARLGAVSEALALLDRLLTPQDSADEERACLRPRLLRDLAYKNAGDPDRDLLKQSAALYEAVYRKTGGTYPGVNAAEVHALAGDVADAKSVAKEILRKIVSDQSGADDYWRRSTLAECRLLEGDIAAAASLFASAGAALDATPGKRAMTRKQLGRLAHNVGIDRAWIDRSVPQPGVMYFCGPMAWGTPEDDTPTTELSEALREYLKTHKIGWAFGALASGADTVVAEALLEAGASLNIYLPLPPHIFLKESVPGRLWRERYAACIRQAESVDWARRAHPCNAAYVVGAEIAMGKALLQAQQLETSAVGFFATQKGRTATNSHSIQNMLFWSRPGNAHVEISSVWPPRPNGKRLDEPQDDALYFAVIAQGADGPLPAAPHGAIHVAQASLDMYLFSALEDALDFGLRLARDGAGAAASCWLDVGVLPGKALTDGSAAAHFIAAANKPSTEPGRLYASDAFASVAALFADPGAHFEYVGFTPTREKIDPCALYLVQA